MSGMGSSSDTDNLRDEHLPTGLPLADIRINTPVSIVVPTFREAENIPHLIDRIKRLRDIYDFDCELIFVDDDSRDGSVEIVERAALPWVRILVRTENRGLSQAVIEGFHQARYPVIVCMDCDLSHPPERIPQMILALASGQQLVLGSRYVAGGSTDDDWGLLRWLNSRIATLLASPLTRARDPMSGFFAMRREQFDDAEDLNPIGYKIALELIVKCGIENVGEIPIHFTDRVRGQSKLTLKEQLRYIQHVRRLYLHKFSNAMHLAQFLVVGFSGAIVNLALVSILNAFGLPESLCLAGGIAVSLVSNFLLNRRFTFSYARDDNLLTQFMGFLAASSIGLAVNYGVALSLSLRMSDDLTFGLQLAALAGIAAGFPNRPNKGAASSLRSTSAPGSSNLRKLNFASNRMISSVVR